MFRRLREWGRKWSYDGHGINCDGQRNLTFYRHNDDHRTRDTLGNRIAEFCQEAHRLQVQSFNVDGADRPPTVFVELDEDELDFRSSNMLMNVDIVHKDGRRTRFNFTIGTVGTRIKGSVRACRIDCDGTVKTVTGVKADYGITDEERQG